MSKVTIKATALLAGLALGDALYGIGQETIPENISSGALIPTENGEHHRTTKGALLEWHLECSSPNLRSVDNPVSPSGTLKAYFPIGDDLAKYENEDKLLKDRRIRESDLTSRLVFAFKTALFFGKPESSLTWVNAGMFPGSKLAFLNDQRVMQLKLNIDVGKMRVEDNGDITSDVAAFRIGSPRLEQSDVPADTSKNKRYMPREGLVTTWSTVTGVGTSARINTQIAAGLGMTLSAVSRTGSEYACHGWRSPLYLFFDKARPRFSGISYFPLDPFGRPVRWVEPRAPGYLLVLDKDRDGVITTAGELFGDASAPNGFEELKKYDINQDRRIDDNDSIFHRLRLWADANGDAKTQPGELISLTEKGVLSIELNYDSGTVTPLPSGAELRQRAKFVFKSGREGGTRRGDIIDVWLGVVDAAVVAHEPFLPAPFGGNLLK